LLKLNEAEYPIIAKKGNVSLEALSKRTYHKESYTERKPIEESKKEEDETDKGLVEENEKWKALENRTFCLCLKFVRFFMKV